MFGLLTLGLYGPEILTGFGATNGLATGEVLSGLSMVYTTGSQSKSPFRQQGSREIGLP